MYISNGLKCVTLAAFLASAGVAQAAVTLDLEDKVIDLSVVSLPYTFTYSIAETSTAPDTGRLIQSFDTQTSFSPLPSNIELLGVSSSLPGYSAGAVNPTPPAPLGSSVVNSPALSPNPALPASTPNILTYTLRINSMPTSVTTYTTSLSSLMVDGTNGMVIPTTNIGGFLTFLPAAIPEPLTAAGVLLLTSRVLGRRCRESL